MPISADETPLQWLLTDENRIESFRNIKQYNCVMFTSPTMIFYRGVPGFATDCPCGVWCHLPPVCWFTVWKSSLNGNRFVSLTFFVVFDCLTFK